MQWFDVDKKGLAKLLDARGKAFALHELISNAWDEKCSRVDVRLTRIPNSRFVELEVEDDNPAGFSDLTHAFILFAESRKKVDAAARGRFNLGEKLVLALCEEAEIVSTTGTVRFDEQGRHRSRVRRAAGSLFRGVLRMTDDELAECRASVARLIPPAGVVTTFNGEPLRSREPLRVFEATIPTELADDEGRLRRTERRARIEIYQPTAGEQPTIYEMGIQVVQVPDRFHVNVQQKVPLTFDRTNVTPAYLARIRALVLEHMAHELSADDASQAWVRSAIHERAEDLSDETVRCVMDLRFGEKRVSFDPSDPEANHRAVAAGYQVVYGSQLGASEWEAARRAGAILPAGKVTPSPRPFAEDGRALRVLEQKDWTPAIAAVVAYSRRIGQRLLGTSIAVTVANDIAWPFAGAYGPGSLTLNLGRLGHRWFNGSIMAINELLIHEFAHHASGNHLSEAYYDALSKLGAKLTQLALDEPELFRIEVAAAA